MSNAPNWDTNSDTAALAVLGWQWFGAHWQTRGWTVGVARVSRARLASAGTQKHQADFQVPWRAWCRPRPCRRRCWCSSDLATGFRALILALRPACAYWPFVAQQMWRPGIICWQLGCQSTGSARGWRGLTSSPAANRMALLYGNWRSGTEPQVLPDVYDEDRQGMRWQGAAVWEVIVRDGFVAESGVGDGSWRDTGVEGVVRAQWRDGSALAWSQPRMVMPRG